MTNMDKTDKKSIKLTNERKELLRRMFFEENSYIENDFLSEPEYNHTKKALADISNKKEDPDAILDGFPAKLMKILSVLMDMKIENLKSEFAKLSAKKKGHADNHEEIIDYKKGCPK